MSDPIRQVLEEIGDDLFVGRGAELRQLGDALVAARQGPVAVYVHGPARIGKTSLVRHFLQVARSHGATAVYVADPEGASVAEAIVAALDLRDHHPADLMARARDLVRDAGGGTGLVVAIDDYDRLGAVDERRLREDLLYHFARGVLIVIVGRRPPDRVWPGERIWRRFARSIEVRDLTSADAEALLLRHGVGGEGTRREVTSLAGGHPTLLTLTSDLLVRSGGASAARVGAGPGQALGSLLVDGIFTEAGFAPAPLLRETLSAASVLPTFTRAMLEELLPIDGTDVWEQLTSLPCVAEEGSTWRIVPGVARLLAHEYRLAHPWRDAFLRRLALGITLRNLRSGGDASSLLGAWAWVAHLACESAWQAALSGADGWKAERLAGGDAERLFAPSSLDVMAIGLRAESGLIGAAFACRMFDESVIFGPFHLAKGCDDLAGALVRQAVTLALGRRVTFREVPPRMDGILRQLGFICRHGAYTLPGPEGMGVSWLEDVARPSLPVIRRGAERLEATKEVLAALPYDDALLETEGGHYISELNHARASAPKVRQWVLDAMTSDHLAQMSESDTLLLKNYYLLKKGPHEALAGTAGLTRTTYFRHLNRAIGRLGDLLFGLFDGIPPRAGE